MAFSVLSAKYDIAKANDVETISIPTSKCWIYAVQDVLNVAF